MVHKNEMAFMLQPVMLSPAKAGFWTLSAPVIAWVGYHVFIILLVYYGPIYWDVENYLLLSIFLIFANAAFVFGYMFGLLGKPCTTSIDPTLRLFKVGAIITLIMLIPNMQIYTGKGIEDVGAALADQGEAWNQTQDQIRNTSGIRTYFALLRGLLAPFTLSVVPIMVFRWKELSFFWKAMGLLATGAIIVFSLARGTDKETVELAIIIGAGVAITLQRKRIMSRSNNKLRSGKWSRLIALGIVIALFVSAFNLFVTRKNARLGEIDIYCQSVTLECADYDHPVLSWLPESSRGSGAIVVNYLTQGMYGLSQALEMPFQSAFGVGHSAFLIAQVERAQGEDSALLNRTYTFKLDAEGWPRKHSWSTAYPWIANDIGFTGAVFLMSVWGFLLALVWRDVFQAGNPLAYLVLICYTFTLFYIPMNFQMTQTVEYYLPSIVWTVFWLFTRKRIGGGAAVRTVQLKTGQDLASIPR